MALRCNVWFAKRRLPAGWVGLRRIAITVEENPAPQLEIQKPPTAFGCGTNDLTMRLQQLFNVAWLDELSLRHAPVRKNAVEFFKKLIS